MRISPARPEYRLAILTETRLCIACSRQKGSDLVLVDTTWNLGNASSLEQTGTDIGRVEIRRRRCLPCGSEPWPLAGGSEDRARLFIVPSLLYNTSASPATIKSLQQMLAAGAK